MHALRLVSLALALCACVRAGAAEPVAFLVARSGPVEVAAAGSSTFTRAVLDQQLRVGDVVRTGPDAGANVLFADDALLSLAEDSALEIAGPRRARALHGGVRALVAVEGFELHLPGAFVSADAADLALALDDGAEPPWRVCLREGAFRVRDARGALRPEPRQCVIETAGGGLAAHDLPHDQGSIPGGGLPPLRGPNPFRLVFRGLPLVGGLRPVPPLHLVVIEPEPLQAQVATEPIEMQVVEPDPIELILTEPDPIDLMLAETEPLVLQIGDPEPPDGGDPVPIPK